MSAITAQKTPAQADAGAMNRTNELSLTTYPPNCRLANDGGSDAGNSYFKAIRNPEALELLAAYPPAFCLLYLIAYRAQRTDGFNRYGLKPGEALVGDHKKCGISEWQYRTAKVKLEKWGFSTFKATTHGTVATLTNSRIFDINIERNHGQNHGQATDRPRTGHGQATTTKNAKKAKEEKNAEEGMAGRWEDSK